MENRLNIRIGHLKIVDHLILGMSVHRLQTNGHGLNYATVENIPLQSWQQVSAGLKQGDLHGAFIAVPLAMDLFDAGLDISFLMFVHRSGSLMVTSKAAGKKNISDLKGKTVLISHDLSVQHMLLHKILATAGLKIKSFNSAKSEPHDVLAEPVSPYLMRQLLEADEDRDIGACMVSEPYGSQAIAMGVADRLCTSDSLWKDHPCCGFVVQNALTRSHGDALEELITHFFQSAQLLTVQNNEKILDCAETFLGQERDIIRQALFHSGVSFHPEKLVPNREKLEIIQAYMTDIMEVMPNRINLNSFLNPVHAIKAVSEMRL
ncbi:MAG: ABC transporter substrate-binding protein [Desulfobacula sp.]|nr:ABC transporter substrate-binding protein [Desulfobacula sp.]